EQLDGRVERARRAFDITGYRLSRHGAVLSTPAHPTIEPAPLRHSTEKRDGGQISDRFAARKGRVSTSTTSWASDAPSASREPRESTSRSTPAGLSMAHGQAFAGPVDAEAVRQLAALRILRLKPMVSRWAEVVARFLRVAAAAFAVGCGGAATPVAG